MRQSRGGSGLVSAGATLRLSAMDGFGGLDATALLRQGALRFQVKLPGYVAPAEVRMEVSEAVVRGRSVATFWSRTGDELTIEGTSMLYRGAHPYSAASARTHTDALGNQQERTHPSLFLFMQR